MAFPISNSNPSLIPSPETTIPINQNPENGPAASAASAAAPVSPAYLDVSWIDHYINWLSSERRFIDFAFLDSDDGMAVAPPAAPEDEPAATVVKRRKRSPRRRIPWSKLPRRRLQQGWEAHLTSVNVVTGEKTLSTPATTATTMNNNRAAYGPCPPPPPPPFPSSRSTWENTQPVNVNGTAGAGGGRSPEPVLQRMGYFTSLLMGLIPCDLSDD